jgi:hypothetical protein
MEPHFSQKKISSERMGLAASILYTVVPWQLQRIELCFIINSEIFKQYFFETEFL